MILEAFEGERLVDLEFKASLGYTVRPCLNKHTSKTSCLVFLKKNQARGYRQESACLSSLLYDCKNGTEVDNISHSDTVSCHHSFLLSI